MIRKDVLKIKNLKRFISHLKSMFFRVYEEGSENRIRIEKFIELKIFTLFPYLI